MSLYNLTKGLKMSFLKFIFAMFLSFLPGILGAIVTPMNTGANLWYNTLNVSMLTPAGWIFPLVWGVLYFMIGLAIYFIMVADNSRKIYDKTSAYIYFAINLVFNTLWSFAFFGAQMPEVALLILVALIIDVVFMARAFFKISHAACWLIVPYIVWLMFAFYLNGMIIYLN